MFKFSIVTLFLYSLFELGTNSGDMLLSVFSSSGSLSISFFPLAIYLFRKRCCLYCRVPTIWMLMIASLWGSLISSSELHISCKLVVGSKGLLRFGFGKKNLRNTNSYVELETLTHLFQYLADQADKRSVKIQD